MNKYTPVSLVIPVYNEAERIRDCLEAVARQTVQPLEVIVVDNNSTDGTAAIAAAFPFVQVLHEPRQGVVYARDRGFNAARGDIIARIDGDTLIPENWLATIIELFADPTLSAVSGAMRYRDVALADFVSKVDLFWRRRMAKLLGREVTLQGASMALRRDVWRAVRSQVCHVSGQHEDLDLAIHATALNFTVRFDERLVAAICFRQADYNWRTFKDYGMLCPDTYRQHGRKSYRKMYQLIFFVLALYPAIRIISKGYDSELGKFSWAKAFGAPVVSRVNPATFVD